ncbi:hypothetical protein PIIN_06270 [Serendipita indica DSM 11827]|uniref:Amidohydrolase-related domain-containing protein n=1 Tax=Serendipita indica (strain DSM 11827) TaxID=1109443 RepID=G4TLZ3_SERID|nr:hypothetical protein PIIN_06270 [Serendipita indica DSM 11827]
MDFRLYDSRVAWQVRNHAANLTHLNIAVMSYEYEVRQLLKDVAPQLTRLRFLGRWLLIPYGRSWVDTMLEDLQPLRCLGRTLVFLHISVQRVSSTTCPTKLLPHIEALFPKLRIILESSLGSLVRRNTCDWIQWRRLEFNPNEWQILEDKFEKALQDVPEATSDDPAAGVYMIQS